MKILVVGATGRFAGLVVPELTRRGATVRALVHDSGKEPAARQAGAEETVVADLNEPDTLPAAVKGVDAVFHIGPAFAPSEARMGISLVHAAKNADVRKFVFSGVIHPSIAKMRNHSEKLPVEEAMLESGMNFAILQPTMFMQNLAASWPRIVESGRFALPYSTQARACYVDYRDVAEAAALALTSDRLDYGTFELCAGGMLNRIELAALMSEAAGRKIEATQISFEEFATQSKIPEGPLREGLRKMYEDYDQFGFPGGNDLVLRAVLEREPRTLRAYLGELAGKH